jgi:glucan biosynthesis protein C
MKRKHYLDQLRALLMFLGIPYHSSLVYSAQIDWTVSSPEKSVILTWLPHFIHTFRMPAFMLISGFFCLLMIKKQGERKWLKSRFVRLGVPLISIMLLVNPFILLAHSVSTQGFADSVPYWISQMSKLGPHWRAHLWFLIDLLIYSSLFAFCWRYRASLRLISICRSVFNFIDRHWINACFALILLAGGTVVVASVAKALDINYLLSGLFQPVRTVVLAPFFLLGAALAYRSDWLERFTTVNWTCWTAAVVSCLILMVVEPRSEVPYKIVAYFFEPIAGILFAHVLMSGAQRWLNRSDSLTRKMVDASMTVYLFHILFICWFAVALFYVALDPLLKFGLIVVVTTITSLGVHTLLSRSVALMFLFNGVQPSVLSGSR